MKILFVSRAYPPVVGGIENQNYELSIWLSKHAEVTTIANPYGKKALAWFLPTAFIKILPKLRQYDVILLGDGVLSVLGWLIKIFYPKKKIACITHGLDITYPFWIYKKLWVGLFLKKMDLLIAVGNETIRAGVIRGISEKLFKFIPNGVDTEKYFQPHSKTELEQIINQPLNGNFFLLTSGRLAKRKGVAWFIENVMPKLPSYCKYIIAGEGPDRPSIEAAIKKTGLSKQIKMLGYVSEKEKEILFNTCDVFVQPNIKVEGDMEGFGISVIEAISCQRPLIASNLEGLADAVKDEKNGFLIEPYDSNGYAAKIYELLQNESYRKEFGVSARKYVIDNYHWNKISAQYIETLTKI